MAVNFSIRELRELAAFLSEKTGEPFEHYSPSFLKRRLGSFSDRKGIKKIDQLFQKASDAIFVDELMEHMTVPVTELFRDAGTWRKIREFLKSMAGRDEITVWIPKVASGEELYSLLIVARELEILDRLSILAGYCCENQRIRIMRGEISGRNIEVNQYNYKRFEGKEGLDSYLRAQESEWVIDPELLKGVELIKGPFITVTPKRQVDLVLFRNELLYFRKDYHKCIKEHIDKCIKPGGILCIGVGENLHDIDNRLECIDDKEKIFRKFSALAV